MELRIGPDVIATIASAEKDAKSVMKALWVTVAMDAVGLFLGMILAMEPCKMGI